MEIQQHLMSARKAAAECPTPPRQTSGGEYHGRMMRKTDVIEVDKSTADALKARAADRGISVAELLAELVSQSGPVALDGSEIAELDRRWAEIEAGAQTIENADVVHWLESWGSPQFQVAIQQRLND
jgi:hypothetical protein